MHNVQVKLHNRVQSRKEHLFHKSLKRHLKHLLLCSLFTVTAQLCTVNKSRKYMCMHCMENYMYKCPISKLVYMYKTATHLLLSVGNRQCFSQDNTYVY